MLAAAGCSRSAAPAPAGQSNNPPALKRIISAAPSNTEIVTGLGMGGLLIAVDKYSGEIPGVPPGLPQIDFFYPDTEAIIGLAPDLILVNEVNTFGVADNPFKLLGDLGIKVAYVPASSSIEGIYRDILLIAETLGIGEKGEALVQSMKDEIAEISAAKNAADPSERKSVYFEIDSNPSIVTFGHGVYLDEMIEIAGGKNIFAEQKGYFSPSEEEIINRDPEVIFVLLYHGYDIQAGIAGRRSFENIRAIKENRIYTIDADSAARPSQNIMLALREIVKALDSCK